MKESTGLINRLAREVVKTRLTKGDQVTPPTFKEQSLLAALLQVKRSTSGESYFRSHSLLKVVILRKKWNPVALRLFSLYFSLILNIERNLIKRDKITSLQEITPMGRNRSPAVLRLFSILLVTNGE